MSQSARIHAALVEQAMAAGGFRSVTYSSGHPSVKTLGDEVSPASVEANEVSASFDLNRQRGLDLGRERRRWEWSLRLRFNGEVSAEDFEARLLQTPVVVARESATDQAVYLNLTSARYEHPPRIGPSNGSVISYTLDASLSRT